MTDFKQYEKNTAFPIHATFDDDQVDKDTMKPGGFFTKKLYAEEMQSEERNKPAEEERENSESDNEGRRDGGADANYNGFCRTE